MKKHRNIEKLIPNLNEGEILEYEVSKMESFKFNESIKNSFCRNYFFELRKIGGKNFEVYYPKSVLSASKYFHSLDGLMTKMRNPQNSTIYFTINKDDEIELENYKEIQLNLKKLKKELIKNISDEDIVDEIKMTFQYLSSREKMERYFLEDLNYIFDYYGFEKEDDFYIDFTPKDTTIDKMAKKMGVGLSNIDLVMFDILENQNFKIESLTGSDTISTRLRQDFKKIKNDFLDDRFDFDSIHDISLHYKKYIFNSKNILNSFLFRSKIDTPKMQKNKEVKIEIK